MNKVRFVIAILAALLSNCAVFAADGNIGVYSFQTVQDNVANIPAFEACVPKGFTAKTTSQWDRLDGTYPGHEILAIENSDNSVGIYMFTGESYYQFDSQSTFRGNTIKTPPRQGPDYERRITLLNYMNSDAVLEVFLNNLGFNNRQFVKTIPNNENQLKNIRSEVQSYCQRTVQSLQWILQMTGGKMQVRTNGTEANITTKQYSVGPGMIEASTCVTAISNIAGTRDGIFVQSSIEWQIQYFTMLRANTKELFEKYYNVYQTVVANTHVTPQFIYLNRKLKEMNEQRVAKIGAVRSQVALDASREAIMDGYNSSSATQDRVRDMWSDCINERDEYTTQGGNKIKTSMFNETVAQNGNEFFIGKKADVPIGFDILPKR